MFAAYYNPVESKYLSENCSQASNRSPHHSNNSQHNNNSDDNENKNSKVKFAPQNNNSSFSSHNHHLHHNRSESYYNSCSIFNLVSKLSDIEQKRKKAGLELEQREKLRLKQEQIHRLCAEKEKLSREKARQQSLLKQEQSCDALRRFYERKAKAAGIHCNNSLGSNNCQENFIQQHHNNNKNNKIHLISSPTFSSINSSITSSSSSSLSSITTSTTSSAISIISGGTCSSISDSSSLSSSSSSNNNNFNHHNHINHNHNSNLNNHSNNNNSKNQRCRDLRQLVEKSRAALKINNFIIHHVRRRRTREVICKLGQLRQLELLLTQISESTVINQQRRIKVQEILRQLNNIDSNNSEVICYKKNRIMKMADGILMKSTNLEDFVLVEINECGDINEMW